MISDLFDSINSLNLKIDEIEKEIQIQAEKIITEFKKCSANLKENETYFLSGIQYGVPLKSYLITKKGVEVLGEEVIDIGDFVKEVINFAVSSGFFPWTPVADINNAFNPDRTFSTENIFSISDYTLYQKQKELFDANLEDTKIYAPILTRLNTVFESNDNDYRSLPSWKVPVVGGKTQKTFFKYEDVIDKTKKFRLQIPMFKLSEMYLIAAETAPVPADGITFLNTLRFNRGLTNLAATAALATEITKEYKKEFIGEGQLFFYYKRNNTTAIPNGAAASGNLTMSALQYVVPLPDSEINFQ